MIYRTGKDENVQLMCQTRAENARAVKCPGKLLFDACLSCMQLFRFLFKIAGKLTNMAPNTNLAGPLNSWEGECKIASTQIPK